MTKTEVAKTTTTPDTPKAEKPVTNEVLATATAEAAKAKVDAPKADDDTKIDGEDHGEPETIPDAEADKLDAAFGATTGAEENIHDPAKASAEVIAQVKSGIDNLIEHSAKYSQAHESNAKIEKLVDLMAGTKSEYILYGYGGVIITLGDLRAIVGGE